LLEPDRGTVWVDGQEVPKLKRDDLYALRSHIGYVFQFAALFDSLSICDNVAMGLRKEHKLDFEIRLKTVIMRQNIEHVSDVAHYASQEGMHVFYQPIEQNYDTDEDPKWFEHSPTFPNDREKAVEVVNHLIQPKRDGLHIANSYAQLQAMIPYFRNPDALRLPQPICGRRSAPGSIQPQPSVAFGPPAAWQAILSIGFFAIPRMCKRWSVWCDVYDRRDDFD